MFRNVLTWLKNIFMFEDDFDNYWTNFSSPYIKELSDLDLDEENKIRYYQSC